MLKVGLTGGIASGKSYVVSVLRELGCEVVDADLVAHQVMEPGRPAYDDVVAHFGPEILGPDGGIDRARLGAIVFADPKEREKLLTEVVVRHAHTPKGGELDYLKLPVVWWCFAFFLLSTLTLAVVRDAPAAA